MRVAVRFALAGGIALAIASAITIFGFGSYEKQWGQWGSMQVFLLVALPYAFVCGLGAYAGVRFRRGGGAMPMPGRRIWTVGLATGVVGVAIVWIVAFSGIDAWWIYFIPFAVSLAGARLLPGPKA